MITQRYFTAVSVLVAACALHSNAFGQHQVTTGVVAGGGGATSGGSYRVNGTVGQMVVGASAGETYGVGTGYWAAVAGAGGVVDIDLGDTALGVPQRFELRQNRPNPFNPTTSIGFTLAEESHVVLRVLDILGRSVATLVDARLPAGAHTVTFRSRTLASGLYVYRIEAGSFVANRRMVLLR